MTLESAPQVDSHVRIETQGALARVTLDRPKALNALSTDMRATLAANFPRFARDPEVYAVVIAAIGKAFSAGADVREIVRWGREDGKRARQAFADEYALNWLLECFSKPTVSLIDGLCMGGGVGISLYGTHRVAGPSYAFAMPETAIGLFPDVGVAHVLARLPDEIGTYLALTGRSIDRADAYALGLASHCIAPAHFPAIIEELADAQPVDPLLDSRHEDPGPGELYNYRATIRNCFAAATVPDIFTRLAAVQGADREWAMLVLDDLRKKAPMSLAITLKHVRDASKLDLRDTLIADYRIARRSLESHDFYEGVRAVIIDKDGAPRWQPASVEEVDPAIVQSYFNPLDDDLKLPTRTEMQDARV